jgi:very-short-patch-repair endonuclease
MREKSANPDLIASRIAARQYGIISFAQLVWAGLTPDGITRRVRASRLHRIYRGVYAVGHTALSSEGRWFAAVCACGDAAVLSHRSAAALWRMLVPEPGPTNVTVPTAAGRRQRPGIRLHRSRHLPPGATTRYRRIPVTTPSRTLTDLRRVVNADELRRAIRQAEFLRLPIADVLSDEHELTRSQLERAFLETCRRHRLPRPEVNVVIGGREVDFLWREQRLIVEVDGYRSHGTRSAFEEDRARDLDLKLFGYYVVRFTYRQLMGEPARVARAVRVLLEQEGGALFRASSE